VRVDYRHGDRFDIRIRDHMVTVDQPADVGGDDAGPTPTELFVAGLASCVAFHAAGTCVVTSSTPQDSGLRRPTGWRPSPPAFPGWTSRSRPAGAPARAPRRPAGCGGPLHRPQIDHHCPRDHHRLLTLASGPPSGGSCGPGRWTRLARLGPSVLTGSAPAEESAERALVRLPGLGVPGAAVGAGHARQDLVDVLAAAGPGGLATGLASNCSTHGGSPFGWLRWASAVSCGRSGCGGGFG
jgi:hypothetical protein